VKKGVDMLHPLPHIDWSKATLDLAYWNLHWRVSIMAGLARRTISKALKGLGLGWTVSSSLEGVVTVVASGNQNSSASLLSQVGEVVDSLGFSDLKVVRKQTLGNKLILGFTVAESLALEGQGAHGGIPAWVPNKKHLEHKAALAAGIVLGEEPAAEEPAAEEPAAEEPAAEEPAAEEPAAEEPAVNVAAERQASRARRSRARS
jgi:hypothetical protein